MTKNFTITEFYCNDANHTPVPALYVANCQRVMEQLQILRDYVNEAIHINCGYRTPQHNKAVGGKPLSQHLTANAADITVKTKSPKELAAIVEKLIAEKKLSFGGLGIYPGFIHVDCRKTKARW